MLEVAEEMATPSDTETSVKVAVRYVHTSGTAVALPVHTEHQSVKLDHPQCLLFMAVKRLCLKVYPEDEVCLLTVINPLATCAITVVYPT